MALTVVEALAQDFREGLLWQMLSGFSAWASGCVQRRGGLSWECGCASGCVLCETRRPGPLTDARSHLHFRREPHLEHRSWRRCASEREQLWLRSKCLELPCRLTPEGCKGQRCAVSATCEDLFAAQASSATWSVDCLRRLACAVLESHRCLSADFGSLLELT